MYLILDTETGGIGLDKSLLTASFVLADNQLNIVHELNLKLVPNDGIFNVTGQALQINGLNLIELASFGDTYKQGGTKLYGALKGWSNDGKDKLIVVGKNVYFDLEQVWDKLINRGTWESFVSYRVLDLTSVAAFLQITGEIPPTVNCGLKALCEFYCIPVVNQHDALADCLMTLECLKKMIGQYTLSEPKSNPLTGLNKSDQTLFDLIRNTGADTDGLEQRLMDVAY